MKNLMTHLCDKSLYALGFCSEFFIGPDRSLLLSSEGYGNKSGHRSKAVLHQELPRHDLTLEALWPGLFVDNIGNYWDVPLSVAIDLASVASNSGSSYHLCVQHNSGHPKQFSGDENSKVPPSLLPGLCAKAAFSIKKDEDIWRSKGGKLKMVQPYDLFLSDPHVSVAGIIGTVVSVTCRDSSVKPPTEDGSLVFSAFNLSSEGIRCALSADLFASVSCSAQYGNFQRLFFDLTRLNTRLDFPSGSKFIAGAATLAGNFYKSQRPTPEAVHAVCPEVMLSLQQQIVGPVSLRVDSRISLGPKTSCSDRIAQVDDSVFAVEYALKVLGSAKAIAWYSPKQQEFMVELRFFES
eukprot:TRINITY_DN33704_c0_g1_i10.p1 TRINITY_DN33704_c0_g1~~TRINITY_DN33704_c0_g1_i10.p1  ORF type:complete len:351 (-),score=66.61 TRINITY_DN33704_c0_g1_i10:244-1296(-)